MIESFQQPAINRNYLCFFLIYCSLFFSCSKSDYDQNHNKLNICEVPKPEGDETFAAIVSPVESIFMMHAVQTAYDESPILDGYTRIETMHYSAEANIEQEGTDPRLMNDLNRENGKVWLYVYQSNIDSTDMIIAIRGTESISDWIKNLHVKKVPFISFSGQDKNVKVEQGFYGVYKTLRTNIFAVLQKHKPSKLRIAGHSLGGAVGLMLTYDITLSAPEITKPILFTYGLPRTGDQNFTNEIKRISSEKLAKLTFIVNINDIVPTLPPTLFGYHTVSFSNYRFCFSTGSVIRNHTDYEQALIKLFQQ